MTRGDQLIIADLDQLVSATGGNPAGGSAGISSAVAVTKVTTPTLVASKVLKAGAGTLIHLVCTNTKASAQFCCISDSATIPNDGVVPLVAYKVPAADARSYDINITGMPFTNGIAVYNSSTQTTKQIGNADCLFLAVVR